jgi:hypothetical protein
VYDVYVYDAVWMRICMRRGVEKWTKGRGREGQREEAGSKHPDEGGSCNHNKAGTGIIRYSHIKNKQLQHKQHLFYTPDSTARHL